jgi:hypothetical protein
LPLLPVVTLPVVTLPVVVLFLPMFAGVVPLQSHAPNVPSSPQICTPTLGPSEQMQAPASPVMQEPAEAVESEPHDQSKSAAPSMAIILTRMFMIRFRFACT